MKKFVEQYIASIKRPQFDAFPDPNGIPYSEYIEIKKYEISSRFKPFPDANGIPFEEYTKTKRSDEKSKFAPFPDPNGVNEKEFDR